MQSDPPTNNKDDVLANPFIQFLQSDNTLYIAMGFAFIGMIIMGTFLFFLEGMARVHLGVVSFLFGGLFCSLFYFLHLKKNAQVKQEKDEKVSKLSKQQ